MVRSFYPHLFSTIGAVSVDLWNESLALHLCAPPFHRLLSGVHWRFFLTTARFSIFAVPFYACFLLCPLKKCLFPPHFFTVPRPLKLPSTPSHILLSTLQDPVAIFRSSQDKAVWMESTRWQPSKFGQVSIFSLIFSNLDLPWPWRRFAWTAASTPS